MRKLQNTLYITTQGSYLHKERETLVIEQTVEQERKKVAQLPVHAIGHIFCFGNVLVSPFLMGFCGENNVNLAFFTENGRFLGRLQGRQSGNVLLRRAQYRLSESHPVPIARHIIAAKIQSAKRVLQRRQRNHGEHSEIQTAIGALNFSLQQLQRAHTLDLIRGIEGDAAARYFGVFQHLLTEKSGFTFGGRNRRPPRPRQPSARPTGRIPRLVGRSHDTEPDQPRPNPFARLQQRSRRRRQHQARSPQAAVSNPASQETGKNRPPLFAGRSGNRPAAPYPSHAAGAAPARRSGRIPTVFDALKAT